MSNLEEIFQLEKNEILCREGESNTDLYKILAGKLLIFTMQGSRITPLAYLGPGEFVGELSFFDQGPRSAFIMALTTTQLLHVDNLNIQSYFPSWLMIVAQFLTKEIRHADQVIKKKGLKKKNLESIKPLTIEEQSHILQVLKR